MARKDSVRPRLCPLIAFDQVAGGKYKLRTLWVLSKGPFRYGGIRRSLVIACQGKPVTPRIRAGLILIDDAEGKAEAAQRNFRVTGTLGVLRAGAD